MLPDAAHASHQERILDSPVLAKAVLDKIRKREAWADDGRILWVAARLSRLDDAEIAPLIGTSKSQLSAWYSGAERPQAELFRASDRMRGYLLVAEALADPKRFDTFVTIQVHL